MIKLKNSIQTILSKSRFAIICCALMPCCLLGQIEICDNGVDDDMDGFVDLNDDDCECEIIEPISLIPNPSFEEMDCCPDSRSQLDCASNWIQASQPTTDFIHTCDWLGWDQFPPPQPFPDGQGIMGFRDGRVRMGNGVAEPFWKEYAGACLTGPLEADSSYRFQFDVGFVDAEKSPPVRITFFGTSDCDYLPFGVGNEAFGCPTNSPNWIRLGSVDVSGGTGNKWVNTFIEIVPDQDIHAIAIGPACPAVYSPVSIYYFFDNLLLTNLEFFDLQIKEETHPCNSNYTLSVPYDANFEYQWYLSGEALVGEIFSELTQNYGEGFYQVRIINEDNCRVSAKFEYQIPVFNALADLAICEGEIYNFGNQMLTDAGIYTNTFQTINGCDSIVELELEVVGAEYDTLEATIFEGETFELGDFSFSAAGEYNVTESTSLGCDRLILLKLKLFSIYFPNVFSPNANGVNNIFKPFAAPDNIATVNMRIYDRWGKLIFTGSEWDGVGYQSGVYVYQIDIQFTHGTIETFHGSLTLVK